ncbi:hypothetical protein OAS39_08235 [Pirellulales bacterium]|nr:hypothetical protein [Pirellulales bacterium]
MSAVLLTRKLSICASITAVLIGAIVQSAAAQPVVFSTGFEYSGGEPVIGLDAANLNSADGQIGTFSGTLPFGNGNNPGTEFMGLQTHGGPNQSSRILLADRGLADGSFFANLAGTIPVDGATVSMEVGTRRSAGDLAVAHEKDYDIIGLDGAGNESFHLRVSAHSGDLAGEVERLGVISDAGSTLTWDLPTVVGDDADGDLTSDRYRRGNVAVLDLTLEDDGFFVSLENFRVDADTGADVSNAYTTAKVPYNGLASELARIEFTFQGAFEVNGVDQSDDSSFQGGYALDNIQVTGVPEPNSVALAVIFAAGMFVKTRTRIVSPWRVPLQS